MPLPKTQRDKFNKIFNEPFGLPPLKVQLVTIALLVGWKVWKEVPLVFLSITAGYIVGFLSPFVIGGIIGVVYGILKATQLGIEPKDYQKAIAIIGVFLGIGMGLAALGFTSPAAIGALTAVASMVVCTPLVSLIDKAVECFSSRKPDSLLNEEVNVKGVHGHHIYS